jgi:anti-sigma factor RsiW
MRCEEFQPLIEDYFDGELDERTNEQVAQHVSVCAACASLYRKLEGEQELYVRYECEARPAPDFWDNVMARAVEENTARSSRPLNILRNWFSSALGNFNAPRFSPSLTALIVIIAIGITIGVMRYVNPRESATQSVSLSQNEGAPVRASSTLPEENIRPTNPSKGHETEEQGSKRDVGSEPPQLVKNGSGRKGRLVLAASKENAGRVNPRPPASGRNPTSDELVREAEQKYVEAIAMLSRDVNRRRSRLDAQTAARFERTLAAVNRTIADTRRAARKHPGDPVATQYMLTAYARKVDVLREIIGY